MRSVDAFACVLTMQESFATALRPLAGTMYRRVGAATENPKDISRSRWRFRSRDVGRYAALPTNGTPPGGRGERTEKKGRISLNVRRSRHDGATRIQRRETEREW